jgi:C2 domain-containing protein
MKRDPEAWKSMKLTSMRSFVLFLLAGCAGAAPAAKAPEPAAEPGGSPMLAAACPAMATAPPEPVAPEPPPPPPPPVTQLVKLTVVSGELDGKMKNGEEWDARLGLPSVEASQPLARYLAQHPELADTAESLGIACGEERWAEEARKSAAADPMVIVEVGDAVFRGPVESRAFAPLWNWGFRFQVGDLEGHPGTARTAVVKIHVVDWDGGGLMDPIGSTAMTVEELLAGGPIVKLGPFGGVKSLTLQVEPRPAMPREAARAVRLAVPGNAAWTDSGIDVAAGDHLVIDAADEVCSAGDAVGYCAGPEGRADRAPSNAEGFKSLGHAALIGAIGDVRFAVRRGLSFTAAASGRLKLGVNDKNFGDNKGSFAVRVVLESP